MTLVVIDLFGEPESKPDDANKKTVKPEPILVRKDRSLLKQVININGETVDN
jgi:hypothetical protein